MFGLLLLSLYEKSLESHNLAVAKDPPPLCVEMGFTWKFPRNQDAKVKLKSELISIKF